MEDLVVQALAESVPAGVKRGEVQVGARTLRWVEAGSGSPVVVYDAALAESGGLAAAGILPGVAARTRMVAYDRAGIGRSDPSTPLTLDGQVADLAAVIEAVGAPSVVVGHSWGGMLAELVMFSRPDLIAGLVLLDPADEDYLAVVGAHQLQDGLTLGEAVIAQHASGELGATIRDTFRSFAERLTADDDLQALFLDAHASCYAEDSQARMVRDEHRLIIESLDEIADRRARSRLPDIPVVVLSATTGQPQAERDAYTARHARFASAFPRGQHIVLADTSHAVNQERPAEVSGAILGVIEQVVSSSSGPA